MNDFRPFNYNLKKYEQDTGGDGKGSAIKSKDSIQFRKEYIEKNISLIKECSEGKNKYFLDLIFEFHKICSSTSSSEIRTIMRRDLGNKYTLLSNKLGQNLSDFYILLLSHLCDFPFEPKFQISREIFNDLLETDAISKIFLENKDIQNKLVLYKSEIQEVINTLDLIDQRIKKKEKPQAPDGDKEKGKNSTPPKKRNYSKPSMDELTKSNEGEKEKIWEIIPPFGGYFREASYPIFDFERLIWIEDSSSSYTEITSSLEKSPQITMKARVAENSTYSIPIPYGFDFQVHLMSYYNLHVDWSILRNSSGDYNLVIKDINKKDDEFIIQLYKSTRELTAEKSTLIQHPPFSLELSGVTQSVFEKIKIEHQDDLSRAYALARHTMTHLRYSNDSSFNEIYPNDPRGYFNSIDFHKQADCDVANTYFAILCLKMGIKARHVVGHMVKNLDKQNRSSFINSGTGHAWTEIYDPLTLKWVRIDATPAGDSNNEDPSDSDGDSLIPGDFGGTLAPLTDQYLARISAALKEIAESNDLKFDINIITQETNDSNQIAFNQMRQLEKYLLPSGERLIDVLSSIWDLLVDTSYKKGKKQFSGFTQEQGGEDIDDIVAFKIERKAGNPDPAERIKEIVTTEAVEIFRDIDIYFGLDKSGSMTSLHFGKSLLEIQREVSYLLLTSLNMLQKKLEKANSKAVVRTCVNSFSSSSSIARDKSLTSTFSDTEKLVLWQSLLKSSGGNFDQLLLSSTVSQIRSEKQNNPEGIKIAIFISDGAPNESEVSSIKSSIKELREMDVTVLGLGITDFAISVPTIYNESGAKGVLVTNLNSLVSILALEIVGRISESFPLLLRNNIQKALNSKLAKLK